MKNLIFFLSLIAFTVSTAKAQEFVHFGAKGGINFSNMNGSHFSDSKSKIGYHVGLLAEIPLANKLSMQPEVLYSNQGTKANPNDDVIGSTMEEFKFDYIQVPLLAKFYLTKALSLEAGPSFNFLVNEEVGGKKFNSGSDFEIGGAIGVSYKIGYGFLGSARYIHGFTDAYKKEYESNSKNRGFQIGVGFML